MGRPPWTFNCLVKPEPHAPLQANGYPTGYETVSETGCRRKVRTCMRSMASAAGERNVYDGMC